MSLKMRNWNILAQDDGFADDLCVQLNVLPEIARLLINRGISDSKSADIFLNGDINLMHDPFTMKNMERAADRIINAISNKENIAIYGDYDVDGITACALLMRFFKELSVNVIYYIPNRLNEGYGLNSEALLQLSQQNISLVITVDCGISAIKEINEAPKNIDIIITDHHQPSTILPSAYAVLNPKQEDCKYEFKHLAGVGVAYKLCQAIQKKYNPHEKTYSKYLELVALGTIADIAPLTGENRIIVKSGLAIMQNTKIIGLKALIDICIKKEIIDTRTVGYRIAPRLNAAGRLANASAGVNLLIIDDGAEALRLANFLDYENAERQSIEKQILELADRQVQEYGKDKKKVIIVLGNNWHPGVIGIVASRLVDKYYRPVIVISVIDGVGKGSCRSITNFDMYDALSTASDLLIQFGGHRQAAGLTIFPEDIPLFEEKLIEYATIQLTDNDYIQELKIDTLIDINSINENLLEQLSYLEPYGQGNPLPVFAAEQLTIEHSKTIGADKKHIRLTVNDNDKSIEAIAWNWGYLNDKLSVNTKIDLAFIPEYNEWNGKKSIRFKVHDIQYWDDDLEYIKEAISIEIDFFIPSISYMKKYPQNNFAPISLVSECNSNERISKILSLLQGKSKIILAVSDYDAGSDLLAELRALGYDVKSIKQAYIDISPLKQKQYIDAFLNGHTNAIIIDSFIRNKINNSCAQNIIFYNPPLNENDFLQTSSLAFETCQIHYFFTRNEVQTNIQMLQQMLPTRINIGQVYLVLKKLSNKTKNIAIKHRELAKLIQQEFDVCQKYFIIELSLKVLVDLDLIEYKNGEVLFLDTPKQKLALETSTVFCQWVDDIKKAIQFNENIFSLSMEVR